MIQIAMKNVLIIIILIQIKSINAQKIIHVLINIMVEYLNNFYCTYLEDRDLLPYQKVLIFYSNCVHFVYLHNIKSNAKKLKFV